MERKLKIIICVAIIILISLISFVGVYTKDVVLFKNNLPNYLLSSDFQGKKITSFKIGEGTEEKIYDKDGKEVDSIPEDANEEDYTKKTEKVNPDENLTVDNYKKVKDIFLGRLESLNIEEYKVRLDEEKGNVTLELEDDLKADKTIQYLLCKGDFSITDSKDGTVLLDKSDVKNVKVLYGNASSSGITVYLDIVFNKEGKEKLARISKEYLKVEDEENNSDEQNNDESSDETSNTEEDDNQKKVTITIEGNEMLTTYFAEEMTDGQLTISLGSGKTTEDLQEYVDQGEFYAMLINNPDMPLTYEIETSDTTKGNLEGQDMYIAIGACVIIGLIIVIYMICRFKSDGIIALLDYLASVAILLIIIRFTATEISLNSIASIVVFMILNAYLISKILSKIKAEPTYENVQKATIKTYLEEIEVIIVSLIIAVVFTFMQKVMLYSFGMALFYGIISIAIANLVFLRTMLLAKYSKN